MSDKERTPEADAETDEVLDACELETGDQAQAMAEEVARWRELAVRTAADFDNFRKRVAREREEAVRYGTQDMLEQLLPIFDNFEMGMQAASNESGSMIYIGMDMVRKQFADFLSQQGVEEVAALNVPFDPNMHEAISEEVSDTVVPGNTLRVTRRGFRLKDRLLRPANVIVAKATEK